MSMPGEIQSMHEEIPNSKLEIIPGVGHAFNIESPEKTNRIIWNFIQEYLSWKSSDFQRELLFFPILKGREYIELNTNVEASPSSLDLF